MKKKEIETFIEEMESEQQAELIEDMFKQAM